ncbi:lysophospholipid acyltransferase family protein [uncultured Lamprocystis sp.]|jgi:1-acyl-sn-glycerol-3-phosphate acyltransferase|uniref:lysophospholipid acyltransferase family protein n=1 Tax=uncultured Lamprocystis sp. TaxID=543132 RepID=UPI0025DF82CF|nr:lysophospholipid acyltransferase family protein [uncultured Lamprocystis sp.]
MTLTCSLLAMPLLYVLPKCWGAALGRWTITHTCRVYLGALELIGACRFDIEALDVLRGERPLVIAPNHPGLLDALLIASRLTNIACIMKADIVDNVFLGASARLAGYIRNDAQLSMIKQAVAELSRGSHLLLFPEGTRTTRWPINACTPAAALIASRAKVPIQTVFIETDSPYLGKGWSLLRRPTMPITYRIRLGRRFAPAEQARVLTVELERYFIDELRHTPLLSDAGCTAEAAFSAPRHQ